MVVDQHAAVAPDLVLGGRRSDPHLLDLACSRKKNWTSRSFGSGEIRAIVLKGIPDRSSPM
jgi:hypothetical protein